MKKWHVIAALLLGLAAGFLAGRKTRLSGALPDFPAAPDTLLIRDTITRDRPVFVDRYITRTETVLLPVHDTTIVRDSVLVEVPIEVRVYEEDSLYRAVVSGYRPSLDSLLVYRTTREVTKYVPVPVRKRWGVGVTGGWGFGKDGLTPFVGVGVSYNLINF